MKIKIEAAVRLKAAKHKVVKDEDGDMEYRGHPFHKIDRLKGYDDYYQTLRKVKGQSVYAPSMKALLLKIDQLED